MLTLNISLKPALIIVDTNLRNFLLSTLYHRQTNQSLGAARQLYEDEKLEIKNKISVEIEN